MARRKSDIYNEAQDMLTAPGSASEAITPHDTNELTEGPSRAIYVGVTGNLTVRLLNDDDDTLFSNVPVGIFPIRASHVRSTGTTATNLVAMY